MIYLIYIYFLSIIYARKNILFMNNFKSAESSLIRSYYDSNSINGNIITSNIYGNKFTQYIKNEDNLNYYNKRYFSRKEYYTKGILEKALVVCNNGKHDEKFTSGLQSLSKVINLLENENKVIALDNLYEETFSYIHDFSIIKNGINFNYMDMSNPEKIEKTLNSRTKLIWIESPSIILANESSINDIYNIISNKGCKLLVDSSFYKSTNLNSDTIVHRIIKNNNSDILMGAIICNDDYITNKIKPIKINTINFLLNNNFNKKLCILV